MDSRRMGPGARAATARHLVGGKFPVRRVAAFRRRLRVCGGRSPVCRNADGFRRDFFDGLRPDAAGLRHGNSSRTATRIFVQPAGNVADGGGQRNFPRRTGTAGTISSGESVARLHRPENCGGKCCNPARRENSCLNQRRSVHRAGLPRPSRDFIGTALFRRHHRPRRKTEFHLPSSAGHFSHRTGNCWTKSKRPADVSC